MRRIFNRSHRKPQTVNARSRRLLPTNRTFCLFENCSSVGSVCEGGNVTKGNRHWRTRHRSTPFRHSMCPPPPSLYSVARICDPPVRRHGPPRRCGCSSSQGFPRRRPREAVSERPLGANGSPSYEIACASSGYRWGTDGGGDGWRGAGGGHWRRCREDRSDGRARVEACGGGAPSR